MAELDDGLFLIDGEDAGSTPWEFTSITEPGSNVFDLNAGAANNGSYGYRAYFEGAEPDRNCRGDFTLGNLTTIYLRGYVRLSSAFAMPGDYEQVQLFGIFDANVDIINFGAYQHTGGTLQRWFKKSEIAGVNIETDATNFSLNTWHRVEIKFVAGIGSDGIVEIKVDGDTLFGGADTGLSSSALAADNLMVGSHADVGQEPISTNYVDFDDIKAADDGWVGAYSDAGSGIVVLRRRRM